MSFRTIEWRDNAVVMLDQTRLPGEEIYNTYTDFKAVAEAIKGMIIRGAPAIGVAAAMVSPWALATSSPTPTNPSFNNWRMSATSWRAPAPRRSTSSGASSA